MCLSCFLFFFNDSATTEIYTLSLHDALPICAARQAGSPAHRFNLQTEAVRWRSEEHTSELQSRGHLVCRLLLEKKNSSVRVAATGAQGGSPVRWVSSSCAARPGSSRRHGGSS